MSKLQKYTETEWVNGGPPAINSENLNKIEKGISDVTEHVIGLDDNVLPDLRKQIDNTKQSVEDLKNVTINGSNPDSLAYKINQVQTEHGNDITKLTSQINNNKDGIIALGTRVTKTEQDISSIKESVNQVTDTTTEDSLINRVTSTEKDIVDLSTIINQIRGIDSSGTVIKVDTAKTLNGYTYNHFAKASDITSLNEQYNSLKMSVDSLIENGGTGGDVTYVTEELEWKTF